MTERAVLRKRAALTQAELSDRVGISAPRLCLWENGLINFPRERVEAIATVLKESLGETPVFADVTEIVEMLGPARQEEAAHANAE